MKYIVLPIAALALLACVCGSTPLIPTPLPPRLSTATPASQPGATPTEASPAAVIGQVGDTITQGAYSVTLVSLETAPEYSGFTVQKSGDEFLSVELIVQSGADKEVNVSFLDVIVKDADGFQYTPGFAGKDPMLPTQNDLPKGEKVRGWVTVELPKQAHGLVLAYSPVLDFTSTVKISFDLGR